MLPTGKIPMTLEAVEMCFVQTDGKESNRNGGLTANGNYTLKSCFKTAIICVVVWLSIGDVWAQNKWLVPVNPGSNRIQKTGLNAISPNQATEDSGLSVKEDITPTASSRDKNVPVEIKGAFGFTLGGTVHPKFKLYHDSHKEDWPAFKIYPELTLTEKISIDYQVLLTPKDRRLALIKAKCILKSINDVGSFSQRIQELIFSKYGKGNQSVHRTNHGRKWFYSKPKQPNITICIEADVTAGIVYIQYSDDIMVNDIRREILEKRVGKLNVSAL